MCLLQLTICYPIKQLLMIYYIYILIGFGYETMKRSSTLQPLSREHHQALVLSKRLKEIVRLPADNQLQQWLKLKPLLAASLLPHFEEEERYFLQELGVAANGAMLKRMLQDHQCMREYINTDELDKLSVFAELLMAHVRFEERELFPWLEESYALD